MDTAATTAPADGDDLERAKEARDHIMRLFQQRQAALSAKEQERQQDSHSSAVSGLGADPHGDSRLPTFPSVRRRHSYSRSTQHEPAVPELAPDQLVLGRVQERQPQYTILRLVRVYNGGSWRVIPESTQTAKLHDREMGHRMLRRVAFGDDLCCRLVSGPPWMAVLESSRTFPPAENYHLEVAEELRTLSEFLDPSIEGQLQASFGLSEKAESLLPELDATVLDKATPYEKMRSVQNESLALKSVASGVAYQKSSNHHDALRCYNRAISVAPDYVEAYVARGTLRTIQKEYKHALSDLNRALALDPRHRNAIKYKRITLLRRAKLEEDGCQYEKALFDYDAALKLPSDVQREEILQGINRIKVVLEEKDMEEEFATETPSGEEGLSFRQRQLLNHARSLLGQEPLPPRNHVRKQSSPPSADEQDWNDARADRDSSTGTSSHHKKKDKKRKHKKERRERRRSSSRERSRSNRSERDTEGTKRRKRR